MTPQEFLKYHPHKLMARSTLAAPIGQLMQAVKPRSIRTLSMPAESYDFENMPRNFRFLAPDLEFIHNICIEKDKTVFEEGCTNVPIHPVERRNSVEGKAIESKYYPDGLEVKTSFIRGTIDKVLSTATDYPFSYDDTAGVDMDIIWLDYCGAFTPAVQDRLIYLAKGHIAPCGLIFLTVRNERFTNQGEGKIRQANRLKIGQSKNNLERVFKAIPKILEGHKIKQGKKEVPTMENLRPILRKEYLGGTHSTTPMILAGWSWQRRRELSKQLKRGHSVEVVKLPFNDHEGEPWSLKGHRGEHIQFTAARPPEQRQTKKGRAYTVEQYEILDDWFGTIASHQRDGDYAANETQTGKQGKVAKEEDIADAIHGLEKEHPELGQRIRRLDRNARAGMLAQVSGRLPK